MPTNTPYIAPIPMGISGTPVSWSEFRLRYSATVGGSYDGAIACDCRGGKPLEPQQLHALGFCVAAAMAQKCAARLRAFPSFPAAIDEIYSGEKK
jgi:hypothetical protein